MQLGIDIESVKGFLDPEEGQALYELARAAPAGSTCVEIGGYCGKSAVYLGSGLKTGAGVLFSVDHHRGSEEHQPGWEYHDPDLWDGEIGAVDTSGAFRRTLHRADLERTVIAVVGDSAQIASRWASPIDLLFIDGGHTYEQALSDYRGWTPLVRPGGVIAIHDIYPDPEAGGQAPHEIYKLAMASGLYEDLGQIKSLARIRRIA